MRFDTEYNKGVLTIKIHGEIDQHSASFLREEIDRKLDLNSVYILVFDLSGVSFMDSSGLGMIMGRYKKIKLMGGNMKIINIKPQVDKVLILSGIKKLIHCDENNAEVGRNE